MDKVPGCGNLYIGSLQELNQPDLLEQTKITHILSILEFDYCDYEEYSQYKRLLIRAEDAGFQDLLTHFKTTNAFIDEALGNSSGVVLVHCAMGQSRSAAVVCAYLMYKFHFSAEQALDALREARPVVAPNAGFMAQLEEYGRMLQAAAGAAQVMVQPEDGEQPESGHRV